MVGLELGAMEYWVNLRGRRKGQTIRNLADDFCDLVWSVIALSELLIFVGNGGLMVRTQSDIHPISNFEGYVAAMGISIPLHLTLGTF